jgi:hypothetical protein
VHLHRQNLPDTKKILSFAKNTSPLKKSRNGVLSNAVIRISTFFAIISLSLRLLDWHILSRENMV